MLREAIRQKLLEIESGPTVPVKETTPEESSQDGELATPEPLTPLTV